MPCDACGERIDLFKHTLNYRVLVGYPQRSFAAQACSAEFVCFCTCDLQTRHCDQAVADRLGNSIGYQSYFQYARALQEASQSHPAFAQGSIDAAPRSRFDSAEFEICSIFRFGPGLAVDGATSMLWLPVVTAIASGSISLYALMIILSFWRDANRGRSNALGLALGASLGLRERVFSDSPLCGPLIQRAASRLSFLPRAPPSPGASGWVTSGLILF